MAARRPYTPPVEPVDVRHDAKGGEVEVALDVLWRFQRIVKIVPEERQADPSDETHEHAQE